MSAFQGLTTAGWAQGSLRNQSVLSNTISFTELQTYFQQIYPDSCWTTFFHPLTQWSIFFSA